MQDTPRWHSKSLFQKSSLLAFFIFAFAIGLSVISPTVLYAGEVIGVQITPYTISRVGGAPKNSFSGKETVSVLSVFKKYITTTVLGIGPVKAQSSSLDDQGSGVSILDRFSLFLFCGIASIAGPLDKSNCDYDTVAKTIPAPPGSISNGNGEITNQQNSSPVISSLPVSPTAESSPRTQSSGITSPSPIITYINKYIPVPGPKGEDGRDGRDGKDAQPAAGQSNPPNSSNIPAGYGLYIAPSYPSSNLIGVSTIGYLLQTVIEKPSVSDGLFTGTNVFSNSLVANMITASSTTLSSASITSLSVGSATTTDLFASQFVAASSTFTNAFLINATATNAYISSLVSGSSTISELTILNGFTTLGVSSFATTSITDLTVSRATSTSLFVNYFNALNATTTDFFSTRGVITSATTTNLFTQNLSVGNASTTGNQSVAGTFNVTGTSTLGARVFLNGSVTIGTSSNEMLTVNALVNSNITPAANKVYDLGSPSFYWRDIYSDNINVNTLSAASTTISGTSNNTFSVNSDNGSTDGEDSSLVFFRGLVTPNALFRWNATTKRIETNQSFKIQNETPSVGTTTLTVQSGAGQGSTNLFELVNNAGAKLSAFSANGWLGIGSTTPGSALSVVGNAYVGGNVTATGTLNVSGGSTLATTTISQATITNASTTNLSAASLIATNATSTNFFTTLLNAVTAAFANLTTTGTTTLATNGGAVAINTTVPVAGNSLTVNGSAYVSSSVYGGGGVFTAPGYVVGLSGQNDFTSYIYSPTGTEIGFRANNGERMRIDANGNVGIGTTTPLARLTVQGSGSGFVNIGELSNASGYGAVNFSRGTLTASNYSLASDGGDLLINRQAGNSIHFRENNGTDQMFIAAGGNIGIGTTAPGQKLDVDGTIRSGVLETTVTSGNFLQQYVQGWSNTSYILNGGWSAGTGDYMRLGTGGNGTTTNYLEVNETAGVIVPTGNVGIGTTTPGSLLHVAGDARFGVGGTTAGQLVLQNASNLFTTTLRSSSTQAMNLTFTLPNSTGTPDFALKTDGAGNLFWGAAGGVTNGQNGYVVRYTGANSTATGTLLDNGIVAGVNATSSSYSFNVQGASGVNPFNVASSTGASLFSILQNGNVGIGTTAPNGLLQLGNDLTATTLWTQGASYTAKQWNTTNEAGTDGRNGISGLTLHNNNTTDGNWSRLTFSTFEGAGGNNIAGAMIATQFTDRTVNAWGRGDLAFFTNDHAGLVERMRILDNGNVGIGTTNPGTRLQVTSAGTASGEVAAAFLNGTTTAPYATGKIGIGDGSTIRGLIQVQRNNVSSGGMMIFSTEDTGGVVQDRMVIDKSGNVGIGTTTPGSKLTVSGTTTLVGSAVSPTALKVVGNIDNTASVGFAPQLVSTLTTGGTPTRVAVSGRYVYLTNRASSTFSVIDMSNPASPVTIATTTTGTAPYDLEVVGRYAYVVNNTSNTLNIIDISNPALPTVVSTLNVGTGPDSIHVSGRYAYISLDSGGQAFVTVDILNPLSPSVVSTLSVGAGANPSSVFVSGRYAYMTNQGSSTLSIIDITNAASPSIVSTPSTIANPFNVQVQGRYAYVIAATASNNFRIFDISNPASPSVVVTATLASAPAGIVISGRYAYVNSITAGTFQIVDISNPASPTTISSVSTGSGPSGLAVAGRYAYVTNQNGNQLAILDIGGTETTSTIVGSLEAGQAQIRNDITVQGGIFTNAINAVSSYMENLSAKLGFFVNLTTTGATFLATSGGNVGIGTTNPATALNVVGDIQLQRSTSASDAAINFGSNSNNYIYSGNSSNIMAFATNGSERVRINTTGNVGIGTTVAGTKLTVLGPGSTSGFANFANTDYVTGSVGSGILLSAGASSGNTYSNISAYSAGFSAWNNLVLQAGGGNVGIGTTTPFAKLTINPYQSNIGTLTNNATALIVGNPTALGTATSSYLYPVEIQSNASNVVRLQTSLYRRVAGADWNGTAYRMQFGVDNSFTDGSKAYMEIGGSDPSTVGGGFISFGTNGLDRLSINNTGNVGIGTTTPLNKLTIQSANGVAQIGVAYDTTRFTSLQTDAIGNLNISTSNGNAVFGNDNLKVCQGGACPTAVATSTAGNLFVENAVIIGDGFSARQVSTTELGLYNASGTLMVIFDNGI